jgi:hypothetical protein
MSKIPGFIEIERRVLRIAGARMGAEKGSSRDIRTRDVVLWWRRDAISAERLAKAPGRVAQLAEQLTLNQ